MPTVVTEILHDKPDISFAEFALRCARVMGEIDEIKVDTPNPYYQERLNECMAEKLAIESSTDEELAIMQDNELYAVRQRDADMQERKRRDMERYERMLSFVNQWTPPSTDHVNFKEFMIEQITDSIEWDGAFSGGVHRELLPIADYRRNKLTEVCKNIARYSKEMAGEIERTEARNKWKRQLLDSLGVKG